MDNRSTLDRSWDTKSPNQIENIQKLLQEADWRWGRVEFGAPEIDGKRPFGSSGAYYEDMGRILGKEFTTDKWGDTCLTDEDQIYVEKTWSELVDAIVHIMEHANLILEGNKTLDAFQKYMNHEVTVEYNRLIGVL